MSVSSQTQEQVAAVLDLLVEGVRRGDGAALARLADPGLAGFWFGRSVRGPGELAAVPAGPFALADLEIACEGTVAWVTARLVRGPPPTDGGFTAVLRGTGHAWLLAQVHASLPAQTGPVRGP